MKRKTILCSIFFLPLLLLLAVHAGDRKTSGPHQQQLVSGYGNLPLSFEINRGQTDKRVDFLSHGSGYSLFLTANEAVFVLNPGGKSAPGFKSSAAVPARKDLAATSFELAAMHRPTLPTSVPSGAAELNATSATTQRAAAVLRMKLLGANATPRVMGLQELPGKSNYFIANDPKKWRTNVPNYGKVKYADVYPGVDLVYYGNQRQLEYDFVVQPGADPQQIALQIVAPDAGRSNAAETSLQTDGELIVGTADGEVRFHKPVVYQVNDQGAKNYVEGRYVLASAQSGLGESKVGFEVGPYDHSKPLVIDPTLVYSTFLGGNGEDQALAVAVDGSGNAYVTGVTGSRNFPTTPEAFDNSYGGGGGFALDVFVSKLNASAPAPVYSTYLGGGGGNQGLGIAVDVDGNAYVTGFTFTNDSSFPTTPGAFQTSRGSVAEHAFVSKLNASGSVLVYSTYLRGSLGEVGSGIAVDGSGSAYVTGETISPDFPTTLGALQTAPGDGFGRVQDGFVSKLNADGSALIYSTFLGSTDSQGNGIAVDADGNAYVTGIAEAGFPTTPGAFQTTLRGGQSAFVSKLNADGSALIYSTFLGGSDPGRAFGIALDRDGNTYITGYTSSSDFPVTPGAFQTTTHEHGGAFVTKLNATGSALDYSTYLGAAQTVGVGIGTEGHGIAVDAAGNAYVSGSTNALNFPTTPEAFQTAYGGGIIDAFFTKVNAEGSALLYSTYLGGSDIDNSTGIAVEGSGRAFVVGYTFSSNFPVTSGAFQTSFGGVEDAFVSRFDLIGPPTDKNQCKKGGWETITIPRKFKNQGECVSYVETEK